MMRLLFTFLMCAVTASQAAAQNNVSQTLFGLSEDQRNETFTRLLQDNSAKCDRVIRTLFNGASVQLDVWEALCRDGNSYSVSIPPEPNAAIELSSCRELLATSKMLLEGAGSKSKAIGCRITSVENPLNVITTDVIGARSPNHRRRLGVPTCETGKPVHVFHRTHDGHDAMTRAVLRYPLATSLNRRNVSM